MASMATVKTKGKAKAKRVRVDPAPDWVEFAQHFPSGWRAGVDDDALFAWVGSSKANEATSELVPIVDVTELLGPTPSTKQSMAWTWPVSLWRHACPVGRAANGDELVQVGAGRLQGTILRVDHETFVAPPDWPGSTDALVELLVEEPAEVVADSLSELCARICAGRRANPSTTRAFDLPCSMQSLDVDGDRILLGPSSHAGPVTLLKGGRLQSLPVMRAHVQRVVLRGARILLLHPRALELSLDGGASFRELAVGRASDATLLDDGTLLVARQEEIGWSTDDGKRFEWRKSPARARAFVFGPTTHGLTLGSYDQLLFVSANDIRATRPRRSSRVMSVTETPSKTLLAVVDAVGVLRSTDGGETWRKSKGSPPGGLRVVVLSGGSTIVVDGRELFRSTDDGASFERVRVLRDEVVAMAPFEDGLVLLSTRLEWMGPNELVRR